MSQDDGQRRYGHSEEAGRWSIDLGQVDASTPEGLNQSAEDAIRAFLQAFADVCAVEDAEGDLAEIGEDGRLSNLWPELELKPDEQGRFASDPATVPSDLSARAALTRALLRCAVKVQDSDRPGFRLLPDGIYFHYNSGLHSLEGEPAAFDSAHVTVSAEVDPWLDAPIQDGRFQDNVATASLNRPRLERALRSWEAAVGKPIDEVESNAYQRFVHRYGFRPGGQPDPT